MAEPGRTRAVADWWKSLSGAWRANVGLYALATVALVALVAQIAVGGGRAPQRVEVASRAPVRTAPTSPRPSTTTTAPTTVPPLTTVPPVTPAAPGPAPPEAAPQPVPLPLGPSPAHQDTTTAPGSVCPKNGVDPACGPLFWDPPAAPNQPLTVNVTATGSSTNPGRDVTFTVQVTDPDRPVTDNCAGIDYGDGAVDTRPCNPPQCPDAHGAWDPPPAVPGTRIFTYRHHYGDSSFRATFTYRNDLDAPCPSPYGSVGQASIVV